MNKEFAKFLVRLVILFAICFIVALALSKIEGGWLDAFR